MWCFWADSRRFGSNEFIGGFRVWADRDIDLPYLTAMEGIDGITSKDKEIITLLKKRVQDAAVDRYWNTIPGHNDILTFSENNHKANKKAAKSNSNAKFKLSIVYAVEKTVAQCIRGIAKKVESNTTDIDFRTQFSQVFPGLFWRGYKPNGLQQQPTPDACGQRFDVHISLYPLEQFSNFSQILKWEKTHKDLILPLREFNDTTTKKVGGWLQDHNAPMGSLAAKFPSFFGEMCKTCAQSDTGVRR